MKLLHIGSSSLRLQQARGAGFSSVLIEKPERFNEDQLKFCEEVHLLNFEDVEYCANVARAIHQKHRFDRVFALPEAALRTAAHAAQQLRVAGLSMKAVKYTKNKLLMRELMVTLELPSIRFVPVHQPVDLTAFLNVVKSDVILKPALGTGSRNIHHLIFGEALSDSWPAFQGPMIAEEYIEGSEYSLETVSFAGQLHVMGVTSKSTTGHPHYVETGHVVPATLPENILQTVIEQVRVLFQALNYTEGFGHTEFKVTPNGAVRIIETHTRVGGDRIVDLVDFVSGSDMVDVFLKSLSAGHWINPQTKTAKAKAAAIRFIIPPPGKIHAVKGLEEARKQDGVYSVSFNYQPLEMVPPCTDSSSRSGHVIAFGAFPNEAVARAQHAVDMIELEYA